MCAAGKRGSNLSWAVALDWAGPSTEEIIPREVHRERRNWPWRPPTACHNFAAQWLEQRQPLRRLPPTPLSANRNHRRAKRDKFPAWTSSHRSCGLLIVPACVILPCVSAAMMKLLPPVCDHGVSACLGFLQGVWIEDASHGYCTSEQECVRLTQIIKLRLSNVFASGSAAGVDDSTMTRATE
eukprot:363694-Chlamydomonas_euryale.AAC.8